MFKWYERLRCKHEWELMISKGNTLIYVCKHCGKMITAEIYGKKPLNHYAFAVEDINNISNGNFTFNELLDRNTVLLSCISKFTPELFRRVHKDSWGINRATDFVLAFKYDVHYYDVYCTVLDSKYEHLFEHIEVDENVYQDYSGISFTYAINTMVKKIEQGLNIEEFHKPEYNSELCKKFEPVVQAVNTCLSEKIKPVVNAVNTCLTIDDARQIVKEELNKIYGVENAENGSFTPEAFYKKEDEESSHLNVCGKSTDEEEWGDYPED